MKLTEESITPGVKSSVNAYLMARARAEVMTEKVDAVYEDILTETPLYADLEMRGHDEPFQILKPKDMYLSTDEDFCAEVYAEANKRLREMGLKPDDMPDGHCPALVAQNLQRDCEWLIIDNAAEMLGYDGKELHHKLLCAGLEKYHQFIDLVCKLVVNLPDFENPLKRRAA